jgi:murein DD-endopeptidase MepM/ murein hydrolase activator NlpD
MDGKIAGIVIDRPPSGNMITIETTYIQLPSVLIERLEILPGQSIYHQYAHLADSPDFQLGQSIGCGQFLDRVGLTGWTGAEHLHLETRQGPAGFSFTSMAFYTADATPKEMANYQTWFYNGGYQVFDPMILLAIEQP